MVSVSRLLWGPLREAALPLTLWATLCDLGPRFIEKCRVGRSYRGIARNGRVLLASDKPLAELQDRSACVRFQTWHKAILPGDPPAPYGLLLCVRCVAQETVEVRYLTRLATCCEEPFDIALDVGGGMILWFSQGPSRARSAVE